MAAESRIESINDEKLENDNKEIVKLTRALDTLTEEISELQSTIEN
jgi:SMC interacting uncharacterized protein involved in chromosome segregation